jgi:prepilin-type N-terminal cleavage/methylation domain-containing protein
MFRQLLLNSINLYLHRLHDFSTEIEKENKQENGFSLIEVLVSIFALSGFFLGALQASVYATLIRVQAQDKQEVNNWIQQDIEQIRYQAFILDNPSPTPDTDFDSVPTVSSSDACDNSQYGQRLEELIDETYLANSSVTIDNKSYDVTRSYTDTANILQISYTVNYANTHPRYKGVGADNTVGNLSTEVLPGASLGCS